MKVVARRYSLKVSDLYYILHILLLMNVCVYNYIYIYAYFCPINCIFIAFLRVLRYELGT